MKDMSYYDPEVYDPKKLKGEDAAYMRGFEFCEDMLMEALAEVAEDDPDDSSVPLFNELYRQVAESVRDRIRVYLEASKTEMVAYLMERKYEPRYGKYDE